MCEENFQLWLEELKSCSPEELREMLEDLNWPQITKNILQRQLSHLKQDDIQGFLNEAFSALLNQRHTFKLKD